MGVPLDKLGPPMLLGLVRQLDFGSLSSATCLVQCHCSTADVHTYYASGPKEIDESTGLVVVKKGLAGRLLGHARSEARPCCSRESGAICRA